MLQIHFGVTLKFSVDFLKIVVYLWLNLYLSESKQQRRYSYGFYLNELLNHQYKIYKNNDVVFLL